MNGNAPHSDPAIRAAIDVAHSTHPYYWSALDRLRIMADPNVPTMATSKDWVTHYNPATVAGWSTAETAAVLIHELEHLLRRHMDRCADRDPGRFNVAADAEINQRLDGLPDGAVYPETIGMPRGRTAEIYYGATEAPPSDGDGDGDGEGEGSQPAKCGSAAGGPVQPHEAADAAKPGATPDEADEARKAVAQAVLDAGTKPGTDLREWAETELGIDRAAWYSALSAAVGHTMAPHGAPVRWTWPGRRDPRDIGGAMVPRWTGNRPSCAVVIDTSSSVTPFDLEMAAAAGHYISRVADTVFYACDERSVRLGASLPERLPGGGGTDLRNGIEMAIAEGAKAVVVITDLATPWKRDEPYRVPIIVGANASETAQRILSGEYTGWMPPEWMTVLPIVRTADGWPEPTADPTPGSMRPGRFHVPRGGIAMVLDASSPSRS